MKTFFETQGDRVTPAELDLFRRIRAAIQQLPDNIDLGPDPKGDGLLSCHILARATARVFSLRCVDGLFHPTFQHSWLVTNGGNLIDVYPVGMLGGPILADQIHQGPDTELMRKHGRPVFGLYIQRTTRFISRGRFSTPWFRRAVAIVERHLRAAAA